MASALVSQRKKKLFKDEYGYVYTCNNKSKDGKKLYWLCANRTNCNVRIHTVDDVIVFRSNVHNHSAEPAKYVARKKVSDMSTAAATSNDSTRNIIRDGVQNADEDLAAALPSRQSMCRRIQRARRRANPTPPIPTKRSGYDIPERYRTTSDGRQFLAFDTGIDDPNRILLFCTEDGFDFMVSRSHWFADCTFKCSPEIYYQVFSLHVYVSGTVVPILYALLPNKTRDTYRRLLTKIAEFRDFHPASIVTDFENAMITAFSDVFPGATQIGCFFHFSQCIFRQVQTNGLLTDYADRDFSLFIRCLAALAFVPVDDVVTNFDILIDVGYPDRAELMVNYFEDNFIGRPDRRGIRRQPLFPVKSWNVFERVLESLPRTNNGVEGWHNAFQRSLMCSHPSVWRLIEHLQKEEGLQKFAITQLLAGQVVKARKVYRVCNERISNIVKDYSNRTVVDYLRSIAHNLSL